MLMESKPWVIWFSQGQKKKHLNRMREIQFRKTSSDTEWIKYKTNGIKPGSSKNIDLLKVKRRYTWIQWSNKIQQHFCWSPINHCCKCTKRKIIASKHEKQNQTSWNIGQYVYYNCLLTRLDVIEFEINLNLFNQAFSRQKLKYLEKENSFSHHF